MKKEFSFFKLLLIGLLLIWGINPAKSLDLDSLEQVTLKMNNNIQKVNNLIRLGEGLLFIDKEKTLKYNLQALYLSNQLNYKFDKKKLLSNIARTYIAFNTDSAFYYVNQSLVLATKQKDEYLLAENYNIEGNIYDRLSDRKAALLCYQRAETYAVNSENNQLLPDIYNNIGIALGYNSPLEALPYFEKAINTSKGKGLENVHLRSILNKGVTLKALEEIDSALVYLQKALVFNEKVDNKYTLTTIYLNLSDAYRKKDALDMMKDYALKGLSLSKEIDYLYGISSNYSNLQAVELKLGNYAAAINYGELLLYKSTLEDRIENIFIAYKLQAEAYRKLGKMDKAIAYLDTTLIYQDSISKLAEMQSIQELQKKYELGKLEMAQISQKRVSERDRQIILVAFVLLILMSFGAIRYYRISQVKTKLSQKLQEQTEELEKLDKMKMRLFTNVSHELKTPLTLILNPTLKLLKRKNISKEEHYLLSIIKKHSKQLLELTHQILELTNFDVTISKLNLKKINAYEAIQTTILEFEELAKSRHLTYEVKNLLSESLILNTDKYKLQTIIKNLISNAIKFTSENGLVEVEVKENQNNLEILVKDSGKGIPKAEWNKIFDRYYQSDNYRYSEGGTGIGLAICREYSIALGGSVRVFSTIDKGTVFTVTIPKENTKPDVKKAVILSEDKIPDLQEVNENHSNLPWILLVEDNLDLQTYLKFILRENYQLKIVNNGKEAVDFLKKYQSPQLIISDVMMPIMDGFQFLEYCKSIPRLASIPFIMLTAVSAMDEKMKFLRMGIDDYILKPFVDDELLACVDNLLENAIERNEFQVGTSEKSIVKESDKIIELTKENQIWLENLEKVIKKNCSRFDFSVDSLAYEISLSRSQTHRKIKMLTGLTPREYINNIRFEMARKLMNSKESLTIKAVAFSVGFKDEKYFSRKFKQHFGKNPSDYLKEN